MLTDSPVVRSVGPRALFFLGAIVTTAILQWMHVLRASGDFHGLSTIFFVLFVTQDYGATICSLLILVTAVFVPVRAPLKKVLQWAGDHPNTMAIASFIVLCLAALFVYHDHPLSMDEYAAFFQSQVFAGGKLTGTFPLPVVDWLIPPGFQDYFLNVSHVTGQVASAYWPSFALLLAPFTRLGIAWACNPAISALTLLAVHRLAMLIFRDREAAGTALLLTAASPVFFGIGISYYSMAAHLLANTVFALLLAQPSVGRAFAAGIVGSIALTLHNPVPHMLFALPWLLWTATRARGPLLLGALCLGYLPLCAALGLGWFWFSGQLTHSGAATTQSLASLGSSFGLPTATVLIARTIGLAKIWIWSVPAIALLACTGAWRGRKNPMCMLLATSALITLVGYFFVPLDQGHGWGYRYFHSAWMAVPLLATAALFRPVDAAASKSETSGATSIRLFEDQATRTYLAACIVLTLIIGVGFQAWQMQAYMAEDLSQLPQYRGTERQIVLIDARFMFYGGDLVQNDPWLRGNVIHMYSHGVVEDKKMMSRYYPAWHQIYADRGGAIWTEQRQ